MVQDRGVMVVVRFFRVFGGFSLYVDGYGFLAQMVNRGEWSFLRDCGCLVYS